MANSVKIKRGSGVPSGSDLAVYELGYRTGTTELYVNDNGTYRQVGGASGGGAVDSISNFADNRVLTASDADSIRGEGNLTFDGSTLAITGALTTTSTINIAGIATFQSHINMGDSDILRLGSDLDLKIQHTGSHGYITNDTGNLYIRGGADDSQIVLQADDGSGGLTDYIKINGSESLTRFKVSTRHNDNIVAQFGSSNDLSIKHDSSHSYIKNDTGDLYIQNTADDKDIVLQSDNGSGGVENYMQIDGSAGRTLFNKHIRVNDSVDVQVGSAADLRLYHDGSNSNIVNNTGDLYLYNTGTQDKDIIFVVNDGGSNVTALKIDASDVGAVKLPNDNQVLYIGAGNDSYFTHNGTNSIWGNNTGTLQIRNHTQDADMFLSVNDGGSHINAIHIDTSATSRVILPRDNQKLTIGADYDLNFYNNGSASYIQNNNNVLYINQTAAATMQIRNSSSDQDITFSVNDGGTQTELMKLDASTSRVGINESNVDANLHVTGSPVVLKLERPGQRAIRMGTPDNSSQFVIADSDDLKSNQRYIIDGSGNHTIYGNTSFSSPMTVQYGAVFNEGGHDSDTRIESDGDANMFRVDAGNNRIGISQGSPSFKLDVNGDLRVVGNGDHMIRFTRSGADVVSIEQDSSQLYFYNRTTSKVMFLMSETGSAKVGYNSNPVFEIRNTGTSAGNGGSLTFGHNQDSSTTAMARISGYLVDGSSAGRAGHLRFWTSRAGSDELAMQLQNDNKLRLYQPGDTSDYGEMYVDDDRVHFHAASGNYHRFTTDHGYIELGPANSGWGHINTDRNKFYFNKQITVDSGIITSYDEDLSLRRTDASADRIDITADYTRVIVNNNEEFRVDASGTLTSGQVRTTNEYQVNSNGTTIRRYVDAWSNAQTHDVVYNSYGTNLGDYVYLKASGNGTSGHGMAVVADNVFAVGDSDVETGSITNSLTAPMTDTWLTINNSGNAVFKGSVTANGNKPVLTENGSWIGDLGSNGWTRVFTFDNGGAVMSWVTKNSQMSTIIDGSHFAYEAGSNQGGGFYSSSDSSYANATGIVASGGTLYVKQADGSDASLFSTGDIICNSGYISGQGNDLMLRRTTNNDDRIVIEASETKIYGDAVERVRFGSYGIRNGYSGSAGGPVYSFKDDTDTGMWRSGGNTIAFSCGGTRMFTIESGGDLELRSDGSSQGAYIQRVGGIQFTWDRDSYGTNNYHAMVCDSDDLKINSYHNVTINLDTNDNNGSEAFQIRKHNTGMTNGTLLFQVDGSGNVDATADVIAYSSSDKRLKDDLKPISNSLEKLQKLTGYEFDWNEKQDTYKGHDVGVVAQEVEEVLPEVVATRDSGYKAVKYEKMIPLLIEAIKEQQQQINELKEKLDG